jgi:hypothetical protein
MKMYKVTAASTVAGNNPTFTQTPRVYMAECDTSGVGVTAVRDYALNGQAVVEVGTLAVTTANAFNHNLGVERQLFTASMVNINAEAGYSPGDEVTNMFNSYDGAVFHGFAIASRGRCVGGYNITTNMPYIAPKTTPGISITGTSNWKGRIYARRAWGGS